MDCDKSCHLDKNCLNKVSIREVVEARYHYWGRRDQPAPTRSQRAIKNDFLLNKFFCETSSTKFIFNISGKEVCESSYLRILGNYLIILIKFYLILKLNND